MLVLGCQGGCRGLAHCGQGKMRRTRPAPRPPAVTGCSSTIRFPRDASLFVLRAEDRRDHRRRRRDLDRHQFLAGLLARVSGCPPSSFRAMPRAWAPNVQRRWVLSICKFALAISCWLTHAPLNRLESKLTPRFRLIRRPNAQHAGPVARAWSSSLRFMHQRARSLAGHGSGYFARIFDAASRSSLGGRLAEPHPTAATSFVWLQRRSRSANRPARRAASVPSPA